MVTQPQRYNYAVPTSSIIDFSQSWLARLYPLGDYMDSKDAWISKNNSIVHNPWGVAAQFRFLNRNLLEKIGGYGPVTLQPGQSYNVLTGRASDPNLHAGTAQKLNNATNQRKINETGLATTNQTSARMSTSVLASLDEMYWGNYLTKVETSAKLTGVNAVNEAGINTGKTRTLLGIDAAKPKSTVLPKVRALT